MREREAKVKPCRRKYMFHGRTYRCPRVRGHAGSHGAWTPSLERLLK